MEGEGEGMGIIAFVIERYYYIHLLSLPLHLGGNSNEQEWVECILTSRMGCDDIL